MALTAPTHSRWVFVADIYAPGTSTWADEQAESRPASIGEALSNVTEDLSTLIRQEMALARAEVSEAARDAGRGVGLLAGGGVALHLVLVFVSLAAWWALGDVMSRTWAALVVAAVWAVIGAILLASGRSRLRQVEPSLPQTTTTLKQIPDALKGQDHS